MSQVYDKLKAKGLLKRIDPRSIPNALPLRFNVNKRCAYHQGLSHETDNCFTLCHAIQDLIDNKVIALPTRPSITNNPLPNHNFGKGPRVNCLMTKEDNKENSSDLIYDLPECFMMTWEELMIEHLLLSQNMTYGMKYQKKKTTKHQQMDTSNPETLIPKKINKHPQMRGDTSNLVILIPMIQPKLPTSQGGRHFKPLHLETDNPLEALNRSTQQTLAEEDEVLK